MSETDSLDDLDCVLAEPFGLAGPTAEAQAREWVRRIATTNESIVSIASDDHLPSYVTMYHWETRNLNFREAMLVARRCRAENYMAQAVDLIDDVDEDHQFGGNRLRKAELQMKVRQAWSARLSRDWMPRTAHEHTGEEGGPIKSQDFSDLTTEELRVLRKVAKRQAEE